MMRFKTLPFGVVEGQSFSDILLSLSGLFPVAFTIRIMGKLYVVSAHVVGVLHFEPNGLILKGIRAQLTQRMQYFDSMKPDEVDLRFEVYRPHGQTTEEHGHGRIAENAVPFLLSG